MGYSTILVQINDAERAPRLLATASELATQFSAHLIGLHVSPGLLYVPPLPSAGGIVSMIKEHERKVCDRIQATFDDMTRGRAFAAEMRFLNPRGREDLSALVMQHVRTADIVVASQIDGSVDTTSVLDFPERLAMDSGRPVLMVPLAGPAAAVADVVLVAWNGSKEAARAVFDAMPLLLAAKRVVVLGIAQVRAQGDALPLPDTAIGATLARHGCNVTVKTVSAVENSVGAEILAQVQAEGAGLLVMGAYGHTRLRELVFGGATRHITRHLNVPTLLAH
jgi:nucleotide-binding universal stress UspA family protein